MITGASRGRGLGDALARHLLKPENEAIVPVAARGLGGATLPEQIRELVALSLGGRTARPIYHVHADPDPELADNAGARALFWRLFEAEFGLERQPFCGVEHVKGGRRHEHRVYGLVRPSGSVVDLAWDYPRREKCTRIVEFTFGLEPVSSKHARAVTRRLREEGRGDVADWLVASGTTESPRPIAPLSPEERLIQERTGLPLDILRRAAFAAWNASVDGPGFAAALRARGLDLRQGREGPVVVDAAGTAHLATRLIGAAARRFEGRRIRAADVRARLADLTLEEPKNGKRGPHAAPGVAGPVAARDPGRAGAAGGGRGLGVRRPGGGPDRPDGGDRRRGRGGAGPALGRLRALPPARGHYLRRRLLHFDPAVERYFAEAERVQAALERLEAENAYERDRARALWGLTDIWGIPLV